MADEPSLFRKDVEEDAIGQREPRRGAVLEVNLKGGYITAYMPPEESEDTPIDPEMEWDYSRQAAARRLGAATLSSVDGLLDRKPSAAAANGPVGRNPDRRRASDGRLHKQPMLLVQLCAARRHPEATEGLDAAGDNEISRPDGHRPGHVCA